MKISQIVSVIFLSIGISSAAFAGGVTEKGCIFNDWRDSTGKVTQYQVVFKDIINDVVIEYWDREATRKSYSVEEGEKICAARNMKLPHVAYFDDLRHCFELSGKFGETLSAKGLADMRKLIPDTEENRFWTRDSGWPTYSDYRYFDAYDGSFENQSMTSKNKIRCVKVVTYRSSGPIED
jgi:hypothetical protein